MNALNTLSEISDQPPKEAVAISDELRSAFGDLLSALPGRPQRPMDLARVVNADKSIAHRMITSLGKSSQVGLLLSIPGPAPLVEIAQAAKRLGVDQSLCATAISAAGKFDSLVQTLAGDRASFDAMMSDWEVEARVQIDTAARQSIFRGMKHIHGLAAETSYTAFILHPNQESSERGDELAIDCVLGLHRVRAGGTLIVKKTCDLKGGAAAAESTRTLLPEFCSKPTPRFRISGPKEAATCAMEWESGLGRKNLCDVVVGEVNRKVFTFQTTNPSRQIGGLGCTPWVPTREAIIDLFLHKDVFSTCIPSFMVSRTGIHGLPDPNDPERLHDRIRLDVNTQAFGVGTIASMVTPEVPFQRKLIESQCDALGWKLAHFRAFRVRVEYPIFDSQMMFLIPVPLASTAGAKSGNGKA